MDAVGPERVARHCKKGTGSLFRRSTTNVRIPAMRTVDSSKPIADSGPCRSPWRSGGPQRGVTGHVGLCRRLGRERRRVGYYRRLQRTEETR